MTIKCALVALLMVCAAFASETNEVKSGDMEPTNAIKYNFREISSVYIKEGTYFQAPFTGWLLNREYTKKAMKAIDDVPSLEREIEKMELKYDALKDKYSFYELQADYLKKSVDMADKERKRRVMANTGLIVGGFVVGVSVTLIVVLSVNGINSISGN